MTCVYYCEVFYLPEQTRTRFWNICLPFVAQRHTHRASAETIDVFNNRLFVLSTVGLHLTDIKEHCLYFDACSALHCVCVFLLTSSLLM